MLKRIHIRVALVLIANFILWFFILPYMTSAASTFMVVCGAILMLVSIPATILTLIKGGK